LIDYWVEMCAREAENDGKHPIEERISSLALLADLWLLFTPYVDSKGETVNTVIFMLKRAVRERSKAIRLASVAFLFRILDDFSMTKNKSAPIIYKTLIFSLIENPNDPTIRMVYFSNFKTLFE